MILDIETCAIMRCPTTAGDKDPHNPSYRNCVGNRCMAFRPTGQGIGYCGLAGKPEKRQAPAKGR